MTTAARPTWDTAKGGENDLSKLTKQYSSRDLPAHTKLKYRQPGQSTHSDLTKRNLKLELEEKEKNKEKINIQPVKKIKYELANLDADDPLDEDENDEQEDDQDEDEEMAELMAELQRIKKERALENAKKEMESKLEQEKIRTENILSGNPLLNNQPGFKVKRRWDDDVVFKNCAKGDVTTKPKQFINDIVRSDFHRRFMEKYIK